MPLGFEPNLGQASPEVKFLARGRGYTLFLTGSDAVMALRAPSPRGPRADAQPVSPTAVVRMRFLDGDPAAPLVGVDPRASRSHYLVGNDPTRWTLDVPTYGRITQTDVYPGISVVYYGTRRELEYDLEVAPGADPSRIAIAFDGAAGLALDAQGDVVVRTAAGELRLRKPVIYQQTTGAREPVRGGYEIDADRRVRFRVDAYDRHRALVIDPVVAYSTFLGGSGDDEAFGIAVDALGNAYVTGSTVSANFPVLDPLQIAIAGGADAFVTKLDASGSSVVYSTFLGGSSDDFGRGIAMDAAGNVYVAGGTASANFPTLSAFRTLRSGATDAFVAKLDPSGRTLVYSTFLGGTVDDEAFAIAVDALGRAYVTGRTTSADFPLVTPFRATKGGDADAFVTRLAATGATLSYSTFFGGEAEDVGTGIAVDAGNNAYVVGSTRSIALPIRGGVQAANGGGIDAFLVKLGTAGSTMTYGTFLGGALDDEGLAIALGPDASAYVSGRTLSTNFPLRLPRQATKSGGADAFVTKIAPAGNALTYSTYLGGSGDDAALGIAVGADGSAYVTGETASADFPVARAVQSLLAGGTDAFVGKLNPAGSLLLYSTFLGGASDDAGQGIALDVAGTAYVAGTTASANFPAVSPIQDALGGALDAFVAQLSDGGIVQFSATEYVTSEASGVAVITVTRTGDTTAPVTVVFATADGTALAGADYVETSGTLSFALGETAKTFGVPIINDPIGDGDETLTLTLSDPTGGAVLGPRRSVTLTIRDDERAFNFLQDSFQVDEAGGLATITVTRSGSTATSATVQYATADGTAAAPDDYRATTGTLAFGPAVSRMTFTIPIVNDTLAESEEGVGLSLRNPTGGAVIGVRGIATLVIQDNDRGGALSFSAATFTVQETGTTATITVTRTDGNASGVSVDYTTGEPTEPGVLAATAGADYVATSGTLTFGANETSKTFTVRILNDTTAEGDENVLLTLRDAVGNAALGVRPTALLTIVDDEPNFSFAARSFRVGEAAGTAVITILRGGAATSAASVDFTTIDGSAVGGVDYRPVSGTLAFASGVRSRTFTVPIIDDSRATGERSLTLAISNATGGAAVVPPTRVPLVIEDDDVAGSIELSADVFGVTENAGTAVITVTRTGGAASGASVQYRTEDDTATGGLDYRSVQGTLTFEAGELRKTVSVPIINDTRPEGNETFVFTILNPGGGASLGLRQRALVRIVEDEATVQFTSASYTVAEGGGMVTITVERTGPPTTVSVNYATTPTNSTATANLDYRPVAGTLVFPPGTLSQTFTVPILDDRLDEANEVVRLALTSPTGGAALGTIRTAELTITDDDTAGTVQFSAATYSVGEAAGSATIRVTRTGGTAGGVTVRFATSNDSATAGQDYRATSGVVTFAADEMTRTFTVPILNDGIGESVETLTLTLTEPGGGAVLGGIPVATLSIVDDEPTVRLRSATETVRENGGFATIVIQRGGAATGTATVDYATSDATAVAGVDYTATSGTVTFRPGVTVQSVVVPLLNDALIEPEKTFRLRLANASGATLVEPSGVVVTLEDDDQGGALEFSSATYRVPEDGNNAVITVTRSGGSAAAVTVDYATGPPDAAPAITAATAGSDFVATTGRLTFAEGETSKTFSIRIRDDALAEGTEVVKLTLSAPGPGGSTGSPTLGGRSTALLHIVDTEQSVQFQTTEIKVSEGAGFATIVVERTGIAGTVRVDYATADGTGIAGTNYLPASGTLVFAPGVTTQSFTVRLINNNTLQPDRTVNLALRNAVGATLGPRDDAVLTLEEDDVGGAFNAIAGFSIVESAGPAVVTITRTGGAAGGVSVDYAAVPCACDHPADPARFSQVRGRITFGPGETTRTIVVPVFDNSLAEGDGFVDVVLGDPRPAGLENSPTIGASPGRFLIQDDDLNYISLTTDRYDVGEGIGQLVVTVRRFGSLAALATTVGVSYNTLDGTARAGTNDYRAVSGAVSFPPNITERTFTVPIINDTEVEGPEAFFVDIHTPTGGAGIVFPGFATVNVGDDDIGGSIAFSQAVYTVAEDVGTATITVTRTGGAGGPVTVDYRTENPDPEDTTLRFAVPNTDYLARSGRLRFEATETSKTFTVPILDTGSAEGVRTLRLRLSNPRPPGFPASPTIPAEPTALLRIVDDEQSVKFLSTEYEVNEGAPAAVITLARTGQTGTVTVDVATRDGTGTAGVDYRARSGTVTFGPGISTATFRVPILDNTRMDGDRTVNLDLSNPVGAALTTDRRTTVLTIKDDDVAGAISFSAATFRASETGGTATITLVRDGDASGAGVRYTVATGTGDDPATAGEDFVAATNQLITFAAGQRTAQFTVTIINDARNEPLVEHAALSLSSPRGGATLGAQSMAILEIVDDETKVAFAAETVAVSETDSFATLTVLRTGALHRVTTVDYVTSPGPGGTPATPDVDYTTTSGTLTFERGESVKTISVPLLADSRVEPDETFTVTLSNATGGRVTEPDTATVAILDEDRGGTVRFAATLFSVSERSANATITLIREGGEGSRVTVDYATVDDTAIAPGDYTASTGTVTFGPGETMKTFTVPIADDALAEGAERLFLALRDARGGIAIGEPSVAALRIVDNEATVQFASRTFTASEDGGTATITVERTGPSGTATVDFATVAGGTATAGTDYTSVSGTLTFGPGVTIRTFTVPIVNDGRGEAAETVALVLRNASNTVLAPARTATLTIVDEDAGGAIEFGAPTFSVSEGGGVATITVVRTGGTAGGVSVHYQAIEDGTGTAATAGTDFRAVAGDLTFRVGETSKTFEVPIFEDAVIEGTETLRLRLSGPAGGAIIGPQANASLSIVDDEPTLRFSAPQYEVREGATSATITVERGGVTDVAVSVDYATAGGTAVPGTHYRAVSGTLTFARGVTTRTFTVPLISDLVVSGDRFVGLQLGNAVGATLITPRSAELFILEDDRAGAVQFNAAVYTVNETAGSVTVTVTRTDGTAAGASATVRTVDGGTAVAGTHYTATARTVTFAAGETARTVTIPILNNALAQGVRTVNLAITAGGGAVLGTPSRAVVNIVDDEPTVSLSAASYTATELSGAATVTIQRGGNLSGTVRVDYATSDGTALAGPDYTATAGTAVLGPGVASVTVRIPLANDAIAEGNETIRVRLSGAAGATLIAPSTAIVSIVDNDLGGVIEFAQTEYTTTGESGSVVLTVVRTGGAAAGVTIDYGTSDDTARAGSDYASRTGRLTFAAGQTTATITVPILADTLADGPETFRVSLLNPLGGAELGTRSEATVTIRDDDVAGVVQFTAATYSVSETGARATITVERRLGTASGVTVEYATSNGTARFGTDYLAAFGTLTFAAGETVKTFTVPILDDGANREGIETVNLTLSNPGGGATLGERRTAVLRIVDDERSVQFATATATVTERGTVVLTVERTGTAGTAAVDFATANGTARAGRDYNAAAGTLTFGPGVATRTIAIGTINDAAERPDRTFTVTLSNPAGTVLAPQATTTVTITDDDEGGTLQFTQPSYSVGESAGGYVISVSRTGGSAGPVTVRYSVTGGTATAGADYTAVSGTLTFNPGDTHKFIRIPVFEDTLDEENETVVVSLSSPTGGATLGTPSSTQLVIGDNDAGGYVEFAVDSYAVNEGAGTATITLRRGAGGASGVTVEVSTSDGTATARTDYEPMSTIATFGPGATTATVTVRIVNDSVREGAETVNLHLANPTGGAVLGARVTAILTIADND
ncbi:MAG: SBBP repeat-containing protein [Candidatus Rokubacteria bacterium]|nr:SBBP repeat-containing protein [Candidatus Rokubacteria bacterium]